MLTRRSSTRNSRRSRRQIAFGVALSLLLCRPCYAYIDPGTVTSLFGSVWATIGLLLAGVGFALWPLRWLLRRLWARVRRGEGTAGCRRRAFLIGGGAALAGGAGAAWYFLRRPRRCGRKAVVLGIDGLDPRILEQMMAEGELPSFERLRATGGYARLATSCPAMSPNAWTCIATGCDAGQHGVFDFIHRDPSTYRLDLSLLRPNPTNPLGRSGSAFLSPRRCRAFWETLSDSGVPTSVIRWPVTFPADGTADRMLSGLGVPDIRGGLGKHTFYTANPAAKSLSRSGEVIVLEPRANTITTVIHGPKVAGLAGSSEATLPLHIAVEPHKNQVSLSFAGHLVCLGVGEWSGRVRLPFGAGALTDVSAVASFHLKALHPHIELYLSPLEVDPHDPAWPISSPAGLSAQLAEAIGPYHTLGIPEDTKALSEEHLDPDAFLHLCSQINAERERMLRHELGEFEDGLLAFVADTSDRLQHMFWAARDAGHPLHTADFARKYAHVVPDVYRHADRLLGHVIEAAGADSLVLTMSDHGFAPFRRAVHLNAWLAEKGFLVYGDAMSFDTIVWEETSAYAIGFGSIYVNQRDREGRGAIAPGGEAETVCERLAASLGDLRDPATGGNVVRRVYRNAELYHGPLAQEGPDLVVGLAPGYRASWQTALGDAPTELLTENRNHWSGDHAVDPTCVPGVFLTSGVLPDSRLRQVDVAPVILGHFGVLGS